MREAHVERLGGLERPNLDSPDVSVGPIVAPVGRVGSRSSVTPIVSSRLHRELFGRFGDVADANHAKDTTAAVDAAFYRHERDRNVVCGASESRQRRRRRHPSLQSQCN
jgi:hypothetical protein